MNRITGALAAAAILAAAVTGAVPAQAAACSQPAWRLVHNPPPAGTEEVLNSDNFNGGDACVTNSDGGSDFVVASQDAPYIAQVRAYPDLSVGCSFPGTQQYCSKSSGLPVRESAMTTAWKFSAVTSHAGVAGSDRFNTATDMWFSAGSAYTAPVTEIMIWLNEQNEAAPGSAVPVTVGTKNYLRWTQMVTGGGFTWREVIYLRNPQVTSVTSFDYKSVFDNAIAAGYMTSSQYLQQFAFGNELWQGGAGVAVSSWNPAHP